MNIPESEINHRSSRRRKSSGGNFRFKSKLKPLRFVGRFLLGRTGLPAWFSTLLLIAFFFIYASDFVILLDPFNAASNLVFSGTGGGISDKREEEIALFKSGVGIYIYASALFMAYFYIPEILSLFRRNIHFLLTLAVVLIGMAVSTNSTKVLFSVIQLSVGFVIAALYAISHRKFDRWDIRFCCTILLPIAVVQLISLGLLFVNDIELELFLLDAQRYGGLSGNPNTAGAQGVIGVWLSFYLLLDIDSSKKLRLISLTAIVLFAIIILLSGSGTSTVAAILLASLMVWLRILVVLENGPKRLAYFVGGILVISLLFGGYLVNNSTEDLRETFTSSLGKESDFTGRTELWDTASDAFWERPLMGWSLDNHETVQENRSFALPGGLDHYHNGYLDTLVSGGLILGLFILYNLWRYVVAFWRQFGTTPYIYGMVGPLVILVVMNFSEYSLLRPLNILYQLYLCTFCLLIVVADDGKEAGGVTKKLMKRKSRSDSIQDGLTRRSRHRYRF